VTGVRIERHGDVGQVILARPEKRNALDQRMADELHEALKALGGDRDVRAVLLGADGGDFCAGADLEALERLIGADARTQAADAEALGRVFIAMRELEKPVVAAVRGRALAGGAGLATAADIVVAHEGAQFGYPEVRVGFVPAMVMTMLRRAVGEKVAFDLVATGRLLSAREALELGLITRVASDSRFEGEVAEVVGQLAGASVDAIRLTKRLFYTLDGQSFRDGIRLGIETNVEARQTDGFARGVRRFLKRRKGDK
jgi:methylglutaconyl-CoA hydratase